MELRLDSWSRKRPEEWYWADYKGQPRDTDPAFCTIYKTQDRDPSPFQDPFGFYCCTIQLQERRGAYFLAWGEFEGTLIDDLTMLHCCFTDCVLTAVCDPS
jgi:hypothetical protein